MLAVLARETSTTTGTGNFTLAGAVTNYRTFNAAFGTSVYFDYIITMGSDYESGIGHLSASTTLVRDVVLESSNSNAAVNWGAGTKKVYATPTARTLGLAAIPLPVKMGEGFNGTSSGAFGTLNMPYLNLTNVASTTSIEWTICPDRYLIGNLELDVFWITDQASGAIVLGGAIAANTANTDTHSMLGRSYATETTGTFTHLGTTNDRPQKATLSLSNLDSLAPGDLAMVRLQRLGANGSDTMAGDCFVIHAQLRMAG